MACNFYAVVQLCCRNWWQVKLEKSDYFVFFGAISCYQLFTFLLCVTLIKGDDTELFPGGRVGRLFAGRRRQTGRNLAVFVGFRLPARVKALAFLVYRINRNEPRKKFLKIVESA